MGKNGARDREGPEARVRRLLEGQKLCVLCTTGDEGPHASLVAFAPFGNSRQVVFATPKATRKYRNLMRDPRASLLVDDRSRAAKGFEAGSALTVTGKVREGSGAARDEYLGLYLARHPSMREFAGAPDAAVMVLDVEVCQVVSRLKDVAVVWPGKA